MTFIGTSFSFGRLDLLPDQVLAALASTLGQNERQRPAGPIGLVTREEEARLPGLEGLVMDERDSLALPFLSDLSSW